MDWSFKNKDTVIELKNIGKGILKFGALPENRLWRPEELEVLEQLLKKAIDILCNQMGIQTRYSNPAYVKYAILDIQQINVILGELKKIMQQKEEPDIKKQVELSSKINSNLKELNKDFPQAIEQIEDYVKNACITRYEERALSAGIHLPIFDEIKSGILPIEKIVYLAEIGRYMPEAILLFPFMENLVRIFKRENIEMVYAIDKSGRILGFLFHAVLSRMGLAKKAKFYFMNVYDGEHGRTPFLYSEKQLREIENKNILVIDDSYASGNTAKRVTNFFKIYTKTVIFAAFSHGGREHFSVSNDLPSWFRREEYAGVHELGHGPVVINEEWRSTAKRIRNLLLPLAELIAEYLKKKGY